jgi:peptidyl-tRNA hydrolase, PTH1 family
LIKLIVGLGNPGQEYAQTRHNVGAWFVDAVAEDSNTALSMDTKFYGYTGKATIKGHSVFLLIPTTYMNDSGKAVSAIAKYYKIEPEEILVAHDELDLEPGVLRLKQDGGHGGHNGLRDIISHLHSKNFVRARIGIGHPGDRNQVTHYVLKAPGRDDESKIIDSIRLLERHLPDIIDDKLQSTMKVLHTKI